MNLASLIDFDLIEKQGYQSITGYGLDFKKLVQEIRDDFHIYFSPRMECDYHHFNTLVYSDDLAENPKNGGFHTDFSWTQKPPRYIVMLCLEEDPKSPYFGLNQVVVGEQIVQGLMNIFGLSYDEVLNIKLPYVVGNEVWRNLFYVQENTDRLMMRYHFEYIDHQLAKSVQIGDYPLNYLIDALANQYSEVILNKKGDLLIVDNYFALHKRTQATVQFNQDRTFKSRELVTIRFDRKE